MSLDLFAVWLEPAAWLGAGTATLAALAVFWCYRHSETASLHWYLKNWRLRQVLGIAALYFLALAATCAIFSDHWGWLYLILAVKFGIWWLSRLVRVYWDLPEAIRANL